MNSEKNNRGITTVLFAAERVQSFLARLFEFWCVEAGLVCCQQFCFFQLGLRQGPRLWR